MMKTISFTEFRKNASALFSDVELGQVLLIIRHGRPIAEVSPVSAPAREPAWKQPALRLSTGGAALASAILEERADEDLL